MKEKERKIKIINDNNKDILNIYFLKLSDIYEEDLYIKFPINRSSNTCSQMRIAFDFLEHRDGKVTPSKAYIMGSANSISLFNHRCKNGVPDKNCITINFNLVRELPLAQVLLLLPLLPRKKSVLSDSSQGF